MEIRNTTCDGGLKDDSANTVPAGRTEDLPEAPTRIGLPTAFAATTNQEGGAILDLSSQTTGVERLSDPGVEVTELRQGILSGCLSRIGGRPE